MDINVIINAIDSYGFPIVETMGISYILYYVWIWTTTIVKPVIIQLNCLLVDLIDRVRVLDNDMIRLHQKVNVILELKGKNQLNKPPSDYDWPTD
jgi:hypothetical protein